MRLLNIPKEWESFGMYPDELYRFQAARFKTAHIAASEHDRNGMFHWWLRQNPTKEQLLRLAVLTNLDPDALMASDVQAYIRAADNYDFEVENVLSAKA